MKLLKALAAASVGVLFGFCFMREIVAVLCQPALSLWAGQIEELPGLTFTSRLFMAFRMGLVFWVAALVTDVPVLQRSLRLDAVARSWLQFSPVLLGCGAWFGWRFAVPRICSYLAHHGSGPWRLAPDDYAWLVIESVGLLCLAIEYPILVAGLGRSGSLSRQELRSFRRWNGGFLLGYALLIGDWPLYYRLSWVPVLAMSYVLSALGAQLTARPPRLGGSTL